MNSKAGLSIVLGGLIVCYTTCLNCKNEYKMTRTVDNQTSHYEETVINEVNDLLRRGRIDAALMRLSYCRNNFNSWRIERLKTDILLVNGELLYKNILTDMSDKEYKDLLHKNISLDFFQNPALDSFCKEKIYALRQKRNEYMGERFKNKNNTREQKMKRSAIIQVNIRRDYVKTLNNHYVENNLPIVASIYGPNASVLKFSSTSFDYFWSSSFEQGGDTAIWFSLGFKKIELINDTTLIASWGLGNGSEKNKTNVATQVIYNCILVKP